MFNKHYKNIIKNICDGMFSNHLIEDISKTILNDGHENQFLFYFSKTFSGQIKQTFTNHCQQMLFRCFTYTAYQTIHD